MRKSLVFMLSLTVLAIGNGCKSIPERSCAEVSDGKCVTYYDNGKIESTRRKRRGILHGKYVVYARETGCVFLQGRYQNDKRRGKWKYFQTCEKDLFKIEWYDRNGEKRRKRMINPANR